MANEYFGLYSPKDVTVSWYAKGMPGIKIVGLNQDSMVRFRRDGDISVRSKGAYGETSLTRLADKAGTVEIELMQMSPTNVMFAAAFNAFQNSDYAKANQFVGNIFVSDPSGSIIAAGLGCAPQSYPEIGATGTDTETRIWTFNAHAIEFASLPGQLGATIDDINELLSL